VCVLLLTVGAACARQSRTSELPAGPRDADLGRPKLVTSVRRTIPRLEAYRAAAEARRKRHDEEMGVQTKSDVPHLVKLNAASQRRFAQIWWGVRYPHGQSPVPHVEIGSGQIECGVNMTGEPTTEGDSDWTDFETKVDDLPSGRYRVVAPLGEVTLEVP
jgi:hypothetical protein